MDGGHVSMSVFIADLLICTLHMDDGATAGGFRTEENGRYHQLFEKCIVGRAVLKQNILRTTRQFFAAHTAQYVNYMKPHVESTLIH